MNVDGIINEARSNDAGQNMLYDILVTLYDKFESIFVGHMFILRVVENHHQHNEQIEPSYTLQEVCLNMQNEIKSLLCDYLTKTYKTSNGAGVFASLNEVLRDKKKIKERISKVTHNETFNYRCSCSFVF